jgi:hypothetical protein
VRRRELLVGGAAALAGGLIPRPARGAVAPAPAPRGHRIVVVSPFGGFDTIMTIDPKDARIVGGKIDPGYRYADCVKVGDRVFGPAIAPLGRHAASLAVIRGVRIDTVEHFRGLAAVLSGRTMPRNDRGIWSTLAERLPDDAPLPFLWLASRNWLRSSPAAVPGGPSLPGLPFPDLDPMMGVDPSTLEVFGGGAYDRPAWFGAMEAEHLEMRRRLASPEELAWHTGQAPRIEAVHRLITTRTDLHAFGTDVHAPALRLAYEGLRRGVAKLYYVASPDLWFDTHTDHVTTQTRRLHGFLTGLRRFLDALGETPVEGGGTLLDQTTVVVTTEIGRYPTINGNAGKDHYPETSFFLLGKGVRPGAIGSTGDDFRSRPVDFRTGSTTAGERRPLFVEALSSTLLRLIGVAPSAAGYADDDVLLPLLA